MNYTILIADDEPEIRTLLRLYLENENYQIIEAENGKQALELLKKEHVDLCLLDIMMPEMDGYHVLQELRKTSNIPVIDTFGKGCGFREDSGVKSRGR